MSLDGYIEDEQSSFDWTEPDDDLFAFITDLVRPVGAYLNVAQSERRDPRGHRRVIPRSLSRPPSVVGAHGPRFDVRPL